MDSQSADSTEQIDSQSADSTEQMDSQIDSQKRYPGIQLGGGWCARYAALELDTGGPKRGAERPGQAKGPARAKRPLGVVSQSAHFIPRTARFHLHAAS
jgi:hypothetical protein